MTLPFDLPDRLAAKADPALIRRDQEQFAAISTSLAASIADLEDRLDQARLITDRDGQGALDRDQEVQRLSARLRTLRRHRLDLCLGRMDPEDGEPVYIGRLGLVDRAGRRLLVDWRSPVAEPFFGATHADPMGLAGRRRYRWTGDRITDYWDERFSPAGLLDHAATLDDQSAFIASLGASRSDRMRDVLGTLQADQDAIIRAGSSGALVVDGGPGTGKTVVALHRTAYLLYSDPRLGHRRGGVLFVGPSRPYLGYVADVLPSLGEEGVRTCTVSDLVPEGRSAGPEDDPAVAALKATRSLVEAIEPAVAFYEEPPTEGLEVDTEYADFWVSPDDWADAFASVAPGTPHNEARDEVWDELLTILVEKYDADDDVPADEVRRALARHHDLGRAFARAWPLLEATDVVGDLWSVPAYLRRCAPTLDADQVRLLQRKDPGAWTTSDLPLLDAARHRLGDPGAARRRRRAEAAAAAEAEQVDRVVEHLIATDDSDLMIMSMLRGEDLRAALADPGLDDQEHPDALAGPFAHIVVDEAQELTDAEWQMLLRRCPTRSFTIVGDRAQARHGFGESWTERLHRIGLDAVRIAALTVNYRTPVEVMAAAEPVIRAAVPDANVPVSVRETGRPVRYARTADLDDVLDTWRAGRTGGTACIIATEAAGTGADGDQVRHLTPTLAKGLEFDLVVLLDPDSFGDGIEGAVDRYVAMTRATQDLVVLSG